MATENSTPNQLLSLRAGALSLEFDVSQGFLRYARVNGLEAVRGLYVAVRDRNWGTVAPVISDVQLEQAEDHFKLRFEADCKRDEIHFRWHGELTGTPAGEVRYSMRGEALSTFLRNRIGFCVLHPMDSAGARCRVGHTDGSIVESQLPEAVSPHQPFFDLTSIAHEVQPGIWLEVQFEGDVFEMEDQRNWTDASFKTYCTPLGLPFPVEVPAGTIVEQTVTLNLTGNVPATVGQGSAAPITLAIDESQPHPWPRIGLGLASHGQDLTSTEIQRLQALKLDHLRVDLHLGTDYESEWQRAREAAQSIHCDLEVALFLTDNAQEELQQLADLVSRAQAPGIARWLVFHESEKSTTRRWVELARSILSPLSDAPFGAGTNAYFAELNRERPPADVSDFVTFSINPTVHAMDDLSVVETLAAQGVVVRNAQEFSGLPVTVSPVTLRPRFNPNATGPEPEPAPGQLPSQVDARQCTLFGAAWALGSLKHLAQSGATSVTLYETTGWRGVMETETGSPVKSFASTPSSVFPVYHLLTDIAEVKDSSITALHCTSSEPLKVEALVLQHPTGYRLLLGNLTAEPQTIQQPALPGHAQARLLSEANVSRASTSPSSRRSEDFTPSSWPLKLPSHAVACIDFVTERQPQ